MNCAEIQDKLLDWTYDELPPEEGEALQQHLGQCPECAASLERWRHTRQLLEASKRSRWRQRVRAVAGVHRLSRNATG